MQNSGRYSTSTCNLEEEPVKLTKPLCEIINIYFPQHYYLQHYTIGTVFLLAVFFINTLPLLTKNEQEDVCCDEQEEDVC